IGIDQALDDHLGARRHLQVDSLAAHHRHRRVAVGTKHVELAHAGRERAASEETHDRIPADHTGYRHLLIAVGIFAEMLPPMLAAFDQQRRYRVFTPDHAAIDADVLHAAIGVLRYDARVGVDVASALQIVPLGHREFEQVDRVTLDDVLLDRAGRHAHRGDA